MLKRGAFCLAAFTCVVPLLARADQALRPGKPVQTPKSEAVFGKPQPGVTHLEPRHFPNGKRIAKSRKAPVEEPIRATSAPIVGRQDALILKTLDRDEVLTLILDGVEEFLLEIEPAWFQATADTGYWAIPATTRHAQIGWYDMPGVVSLVGFLLLEREEDVYAGRYRREDLLRHVKHCIRYLESNDVLTFMKPGVASSVYQYVRTNIHSGKKAGRYLPNAKFERLDDAGVRALIDKVRKAASRRTSFAMQNQSGAKQGRLLAYASPVPNLSPTEPFLREQIGEQIYWSVPQDRAVRWTGMHGRSLAEIRDGLRPTFYPDGTTTEHGHFSFVYINSRFSKYRGMLFTAAVGQRRIDELPLCYQGREHPDLGRGLLSYLRIMMRYNVSPDGCVVYPSGVADMHRTFSFATQSAFDASVNKNVEAATYLSRQVQHEIWNLKRPYGHLQKLRHRPYILPRVNLILIYYMVKSWGYPEDLLSWEACQARFGGVSHLEYQDLTYHRNPFKQVQTKTSPGQRAKALVCNFCPSPDKGHGMEFLRQFVYASERDEVENFTSFRKWRITKEGTHSSLWGDYGSGVGGVRFVDVETRKIHRWDDGFTEILSHPREGIHRALFSLGGRVTVVMEESDRLDGKLLPMRFWVFNQDCLSLRAGHCPKVPWKIHLPGGKTIPFSDHQYTAEGKPAVIAESTHWYNIDERLAVVVPKPLPLTLETMEWRHIRDSLFFGPSRGGAGVVYARTPVSQMSGLAASVRSIKRLPAGWKGLSAKAPEGYRVYTIAKFNGEASRHTLAVGEQEGAPVFAQPTTVSADGTARVDLLLDGRLDTWSAEPRFFIRSVEGGNVVAQARHHELELTAPDGDVTTTVVFFCDTRKGALQFTQQVTPVGSAATRTVEAEVLRTDGVRIHVKKGHRVIVRVSKAEDDDHLGPFVRITAPRFHLGKGDHRSAKYWHALPKGPFTFQADAADRSGIAKVEFYLNNGQLIGADTEAPYQCTHEIKDRFCQFVYAIAHDRAGNRRRSFDVPFGDGTIGSPQLPRANGERP